MKRDMDIVREVLLAIEREQTRPDVCLERIELVGRSDDEVTYNVVLLEQAGLIDANISRYEGGVDYFVRGITWSGHELLDSIRDEKIWHQTKEGAKKAGGLALDLMWGLAKEYAKDAIKSATGMQI